MQTQLNGGSIASAAASCTHLYVASENELVTFDVKNMMPVARLLWTGGGGYAPIIGPQGHAYAMTNSGMFVFAPPKRSLRDAILGQTACDQPVLTTGGVISNINNSRPLMK